ncbi:MAG: hypothetical protein LW832_03625 [Parachlamydia sp.]|jgi:hypothetical protein|nr:hypothetical protein [Parachlamydia sp.]
MYWEIKSRRQKFKNLPARGIDEMETGYSVQSHMFELFPSVIVQFSLLYTIYQK